MWKRALDGPMCAKMAMIECRNLSPAAIAVVGSATLMVTLQVWKYNRKGTPQHKDQNPTNGGRRLGVIEEGNTWILSRLLVADKSAVAAFWSWCSFSRT
jgi:SH3-like domain-containing protein